MLDDECAEPDFFLEAAEEPPRFPEFIRRETSEHLIEEEDPGTRRDDPGELEPLPILDRQVRCERLGVRLESDEPEDPVRLVERPSEVPVFPGSVEDGDSHIVPGRHPEELL